MGGWGGEGTPPLPIPPAAVKLGELLVFKHLLIIILNKATLLSLYPGPLDVLATICKN